MSQQYNQPQQQGGYPQQQPQGPFDDNMVIFSGVIERQPNVHTTNSGKHVANFNIKSERGKGFCSMQIELWNPQQQFNIGDVVFVKGSLKVEASEDSQTGQKKYYTKIKADTAFVKGNRQVQQFQQQQGGYPQQAPVNRHGQEQVSAATQRYQQPPQGQPPQQQTFQQMQQQNHPMPPAPTFDENGNHIPF